MINLLGEANATGSIIGLVVLLVIFVAYIFIGVRSRKKNQEQAMKMLNELKAGDKVVTNAGIYGEIVSMRETNMGKVVTIKTGDEDNKNVSFITVNASVILGIDDKHDLVLDENGDVIDDKEKLKEEVLKEKSNDNSNKESKVSEKNKNNINENKEKKVEEVSTEISDDNEIIKKVKSKSTKKSTSDK